MPTNDGLTPDQPAVDRLPENPAAGTSAAVDPAALRRVMVLLPAVALVAVVGLLAPFPHHGRIYGTLGDLCHAPLFMVVTAVLLWAVEQLWPTGRSNRGALFRRLIFRLSAAIALVFLGSIFMEVVQDLVGRSASWKDVRANAWGVTAGCVLHAGWMWSRRQLAVKPPIAAQTSQKTGGRRWWIFAGSVAAVCVAMASRRPLAVLRDIRAVSVDFPLLSSFESRDEFGRWYVRSGGRGMSERLVTHGQHGALVKVDPSELGGLTLIEMQPDWSSMQRLVFDVEMDDEFAEPLNQFVVQIVDRVDDAGLHRVLQFPFTLEPGQRRRVVCPLDIRHQQNPAFAIDRVQYLDIHLIGAMRRCHHYIDHVRLE